MANFSRVQLVYVPVKFQSTPPEVLFEDETIVITRSFRHKETNKALKRGQFIIGPWKMPFGFNYIRTFLDLDHLPQPLTFMKPVYDGIPDSGVVIVCPGARVDINVNIEL